MRNDKRINSELHLFIIWNRGEKFKEIIINDIKKRFSIKLIRKIKWKKELFSQNLRRFYGRNLPKNSSKENECGTGPFTVVIVEDINPIYAPRKTNQGIQMVNINMFDSKEMYRNWAHSNVIHASNSTKESNHDITLLFGISPIDLKMGGFEFDHKGDSIDLVGAEGWISIEQILYVLNYTLEYVILRNFENYPYCIEYGEHSDVDILCENFDTAKLILNSNNSTKQKKRVQQIVKIGEEKINFDLRYVGDGYLDEKWEKNILLNRVYNEKGFYTPNHIDYLFTIIYHVLIQKSEISKDYISRVEELSKFLYIEKIDISNENDALIALNDYLVKNNYSVVEPTDSTVAYNYYKLNGHASLSRRIHKLKRDIKIFLKRRKII